MSPRVDQVLDRGADTGRGRSGADVATPAAATDELVFGDLNLDRGQVEHLPSRRADLHALVRIGAATSATAGFMADDLVRVGDLFQRPPTSPGLATGFAAGRGQWLVCPTL
jgi:hypothetical protein